MDQDNQSVDTSHDGVWLLLPWYVNGSLFEHERPIVENHLKGCITCRIEYERLNKLSKQMVDAETPDIVAAKSFKHLKQKIKLNQQTGAIYKPRNLFAQIAAWLRDRTWAFKFASSLGMVAMVTVLVLMWQTEMGNLWTGTNYYTLSDETAGHSPVNVIGIEFADGVTSEQINDILAPIDSMILDRKGSDREIRVQVNLGSSDKFKKLSAIVKQLEKYPMVVSAYPVVP